MACAKGVHVRSDKALASDRDIAPMILPGGTASGRGASGCRMMLVASRIAAARSSTACWAKEVWRSLILVDVEEKRGHRCCPASAKHSHVAEPTVLVCLVDLVTEHGVEEGREQDLGGRGVLRCTAKQQ
jgi:hypothetical protein